MTHPEEVHDLKEQLVGAGADLENFDVVVLGTDGDDPGAWAEAGVTWLLTQLGPYELKFSDALDRVAAGPTPLRP
jgi:hypothetical protein